MGILNLSPDSFSETNELSKAKASNSIMNLVQMGADIIDIGGQSTKPNFDDISSELEKNRIKKDAPLYETLLTIHWYLGLKNDTLKESLPAIENLFAEMKRRHVYPTKKTYYILFKIFGREKKFERINKLLEEVDNYGVKPNHSKILL